MKQFVIYFFLGAWGITQGWAQAPRQAENTYLSRCADVLDALKKDKDVKKERTLTQCENYLIASTISGRDISDADVKYSLDRKFSCTAKGGHTLDYKSCLHALNAYNAVMMAEQAMFAQQQVRITEANVRQNKELAKRAEEGDLQDAAIEATIKRNQQNAALNKEQAGTYSIAVLGLSSAISLWKPKTNDAIAKDCNAKKDDITKKLNDTGYNYGGKECAELIQKNKGTFFSNGDTRGQILVATTEFVRKAIEAAKRAGISEEIANKLQNARPGDDDQDTMFDQCVIEPSHPNCRSRGPRTGGAANFEGNNIHFGAAGKNQSFDFNTSGSEGGGGSTADLAQGPSESVNDQTSPFENEAVRARGILDPASAANVSPGQQSSAPGGGGGGGAGGGGGGALGDDLEGADKGDNKEPEIKTNKISGKYVSGTGEGFQGVKGSSDEANPFASLFDAKSEGSGIEEDRSFASGDIDGAASGLFQKISKRYDQVNKDKRIESPNVE